MEVILLEKISKLGTLGDRVTVKAGFARNYLLPFGKAIRATVENLATFDKRREELEKRANEKLFAAKQRADALKELEISVAAKAGEEGKLFGSIGARDLASVISSATEVKVLKSEVRLPNGPIRAIGEYDIDLHLHTDVDASVRIVVTAEA